MITRYHKLYELVVIHCSFTKKNSDHPTALIPSFEALFSHATPCREGVLSGNQAGCRLFETQKIQVR